MAAAPPVTAMAMQPTPNFVRVARSPPRTVASSRALGDASAKLNAGAAFATPAAAGGKRRGAARSAGPALHLTSARAAHSDRVQGASRSRAAGAESWTRHRRLLAHLRE